MALLSVNWGDAWMLAGISVCTVFVILVILVFVLQIFNALAKSSSSSEAKPTASTNKPAAAPLSEASEDDKAAVATAIYLYLNNSHDDESGVLTINQAPSAWGAVLNPRL